MADSSSSENKDSSLKALSDLVKYFSSEKEGNDEASGESQNNVYNYGSMDGSEMENSTPSLLDVPANAELENILEDEDYNDPNIIVNDEDHLIFSDDSEDEDAEVGDSFHLGDSTKMSARNIMVHERRTPSFIKHGGDYELVNTQLKNNVRLIEDVNLIDGAKGRLYLAKYSFFKNRNDLKFAMTIQPDIYEKIVSEVSDSFHIPCNLYFCCHGGDGAHTGVSHSDYVDIKLAWFFFFFVIVLLMAVDFLVDDE